MLATIDIGNSRLKAALWRGGDIIDTVAMDYDRAGGDMPHQLMQFVQLPLFAEHAIQRILTACVAGEAVERALTEAARQAAMPAPEFFRTSAACCGIRHAYAEPAQHGVDRWAALIGGRKLCDDALCVISVGTAVTVDLLSADNRHLGGRIMPGLNLMKTALQQTAGVQQIDGELVRFASNTADAVSSGAHYMLQAAILQAMEDAEKQLDGNMRTFLTGGQAQRVYAALQNQMQFDVAATSVQPHLVMHGLQVVAEQG